MTGLVDQIVTLGRRTLADPRDGARALLAIGVPMSARTAGLLFVAVLSALLLHLGFLFLPPTEDPIAQFVSQSPLRSAVIQWVILAATVLAIYRIGRAFGGTGTFSDTLLAVVWLQVIMIAVQLVQLFSLVLFTPLAGPVNLAGLVLFFWLFTSFIAEIHGFRSRWAVLAGVIGSALAIAIVLAIVLTLILGPEALQDV